MTPPMIAPGAPNEAPIPAPVVTALKPVLTRDFPILSFDVISVLCLSPKANCSANPAIAGPAKDIAVLALERPLENLLNLEPLEALGPPAAPAAATSLVNILVKLVCALADKPAWVFKVLNAVVACWAFIAPALKAFIILLNSSLACLSWSAKLNPKLVEYCEILLLGSTVDPLPEYL